MSQHQKFHRTQVVTNKICSLTSEVSMGEFEERYSLLKQLESHWSKGNAVILQPVAAPGDVDQVDQPLSMDTETTGQNVILQ